jgi:hypothetical protein
MIPIRYKGRSVDLKAPLFVELINCRTIQDRMLFERNHGEVDASQHMFAAGPAATLAVAVAESLLATVELLLASGNDEPAPSQTRAFLNMTNALLLRGVSLRPRLEFQGDSARFVLDAPDVVTFMAMELATAVEVGAKITRCKAERHGDRCDKLILHGPTTGRRSDREYCSNRCRVIALRARNTSKGYEQ